MWSVRINLTTQVKPVFLCFALLQEAVVTAELVDKIIKEDSKTKPLLPLQLIRHREIQLPSGEFRRRPRTLKMSIPYFKLIP